MNKIGFIFAIVVASANCYDFLNGDRLFELPIYRFKRAAQELLHCCGEELYSEPVVFLGHKRRECLPLTHPNNNDLRARFIQFVCTGDCVAYNAGTVRDGEVDREKLLEYLRSHEEDGYRLYTYENNLDQCIIEAKQIQERVADKIKCDITAVSLVRCFERELMNNCPEDKQNAYEEKECRKKKENTQMTYDQLLEHY